MPQIVGEDYGIASLGDQLVAALRPFSLGETRLRKVSTMAAGHEAKVGPVLGGNVGQEILDLKVEGAAVHLEPD